MYCVKCGVELADTEKSCPLCRTRAYHPDIHRETAEPLYPKDLDYDPPVNSQVAQFIVSVTYLIAILISLVCDLQLGGGLTWSGYVIGGLLLSYVVIILPTWFPKPNPVVLVPCDFAAAGLYLLYINLATGGRWFLSFAFPVTGFVALLVTAVVVLRSHRRHGRLYAGNGAAAVHHLPPDPVHRMVLLSHDRPGAGGRSADLPCHLPASPARHGQKILYLIEVPKPDC